MTKDVCPFQSNMLKLHVPQKWRFHGWIAMEMRKRPAGTVKHVIARGDTLSEMAERYNVSPTAIRRANNLSNDRIRVGQTLAIPVLTGS